MLSAGFSCYCKETIIKYGLIAFNGRNLMNTTDVYRILISIAKISGGSRNVNQKNLKHRFFFKRGSPNCIVQYRAFQICFVKHCFFENGFGKVAFCQTCVSQLCAGKVCALGLKTVTVDFVQVGARKKAVGQVCLEKPGIGKIGKGKISFA